MSLEVLHADNHLLAVVKPAGLPVVPDASGDESLLDRAKAWVKVEYDKPGDVFLGVVHRLDRPVSGAVVFARTSKAAARLSQAWRDGRVEKEYLGWSATPFERARAESPRGVLEQWLVKDRARNVVRAVAPERAEERGARRAETRWELLRTGPWGTLLRLEPATGRPHQLRVACAGLGLPLAGDLKYGAPRRLEGGRAVALHARSLALPHPTRGETVVVRAPDPTWLARLEG